MMTIKVRFFAILRERAGASEFSIDLPEGSTVAAARDVLVRPYNPRTPTAAWAPKTGVAKV